MLTPLLAHLTSLPSVPGEHTAQREPAARSGGRRRRARLTRLGSRVYSRFAQADAGSVGSRHLLDWRRLHQSGPVKPDSDFRAIQDGYISVTPLHLDLTTSACWNQRGAGGGSCRRRDGAARGAGSSSCCASKRHPRPRGAACVRHDAAPRVRAHRRAPSRVRGLRRFRSEAGRPSRSRPSTRATSRLLALKGEERVLEIGTGSGYQTVLLSHLVAQVFTIERIPALYATAREAIAKAGAKNVSMLLGDGTVGWREYAPYDAILVSAGGPSIPQPLVDQLADGGRMLVPVGPMAEQTLKLVTKRGGQDRDERRGARAIRPAVRHAWLGAAIGAAPSRSHQRPSAGRRLPLVRSRGGAAPGLERLGHQPSQRRRRSGRRRDRGVARPVAQCAARGSVRIARSTRSKSLPARSRRRCRIRSASFGECDELRCHFAPTTDRRRGCATSPIFRSRASSSRTSHRSSAMRHSFAT